MPFLSLPSQSQRLYRRGENNCSNVDYQFATDWICASNEFCISVNTGSTAICCSDAKDAESYIDLPPVSCNVQLMNHTARPDNNIFSYNRRQELDGCGNDCCPPGYTCEDALCVMMIEQVLFPGKVEGTDYVASLASASASEKSTVTKTTSSSPTSVDGTSRMSGTTTSSESSDIPSLQVIPVTVHPFSTSTSSSMSTTAPTISAMTTNNLSASPTPSSIVVSNPHSSKAVSTGAIAGISIGALTALVFILSGLFFAIRSSKRRKEQQEYTSAQQDIFEPRAHNETEQPSELAAFDGRNGHNTKPDVLTALPDQPTSPGLQSSQTASRAEIATSELHAESRSSVPMSFELPVEHPSERSPVYQSGGGKGYKAYRPGMA